MKIMSLNVNRFSGMKDRDFTDSFECLDECPKANEVAAFVKGFLSGNPEGVVFLHEVPFWRRKYKNWIEERKLYREFCSRFPEKCYKIYKPAQPGDSCTLAIVKADSIWESQEDFKKFKKKKEDETDFLDKKDYPAFYENKFIELTNQGLRLLGIHSPWQREQLCNSITVFFDVLKEYAEAQISSEGFVIVGDLNADTVLGSTYQKTLEHIENIGYTLAVKKLGDVITQFKYKTRIDHALVCPALRSKVTAQVIPQDELELSDHAVIIVNIEE